MQTRIEIIASEFCSSVRDGTHDSPKEVLSGGKPLVTTKHLKSGKIDFDNTYNISEEDFDKINKRSKVDKWDVLISMIGTVGEVYLVDEEPDYAIKNLGLFKIGDEIDSKWLYFYLKSKIGQNQIRFLLQGSTQQYISLKSLRSFPLFVPNDDKEKEKIINFLSALESKIKLNQKMNETLEEIAKTLFKSWFIDFDPVRAKAEGRPTGLSKEISDLFPTSFEESEFGAIPQGWEVKRLDEVADFQNGYAFSSREYVLPNEDSKEVFRMGYIERGGGFKEDNTPVFVPTSSRGNQEKYVLRKNDLTISMTDMKNNMQILGCCALIEQDERFLLNQRAGRIRVKESAHISQYYLYIFMNFPKNIDLLRSRSSSGVQVNLSTSTIKETNIILPSKNLSQYFEETITPFYQKIFLNNLESKNLKEFRDTLLPKLISGELKISDAEKLVKEAGI